jgi:hypothetical protein
VEVATRPLGFDLSAAAGTTGFDFLSDLDTRSQENLLSASIGFPMRFPPEGGARRLTLVPGYRRQLRVTARETGPGDFLEDANIGFQRLADQGYFFTQAPFAELYAPRTEALFLAATVDLDEAAYTGESFLTLSRSFSSRLRDLWLPSFLELSAGKEFIKEGAESDFVNTYSLALRANALNLFGEYGAYPLFSYYRTDSYSASLDVAVKVNHAALQEGDREGLREAEILLEHFLTLEGGTGNSLSLDNRFNWQLVEPRVWSNSLGLLYGWTRMPRRAFNLRFLKAETEPFWSHLESVEYEVRGEEEVLSFHPLNLIARHESSLVFPGQGYLKGSVSVGLDQERIEDSGSLWRLGFRGGIEGRIEF